MLVDTHCHINMMVKKKFDTPITNSELKLAQQIMNDAAAHNVARIINVGTSLVESENCVLLAQHYAPLFATVGIHPNDCTENWQTDFKKIESLVNNKERNKIVGIGECGIDRHYPDYNMPRQRDAFKAHIELALEHDLALVVHSRDAYDETLRALDEFSGDLKRATMHCFSYDQAFADHVLKMGFVLGFGGTLTYPKNNELRAIATNVPLGSIVLETDAPFLPIQSMRGKQNNPQYIHAIAQYIAELRNESYETIAEQTTANALKLFGIK